MKDGREQPVLFIHQRLRVARLVLELVPGAEAVAREQLEAAARLLEDWRSAAPDGVADGGAGDRTVQPAPPRAELLARAAEIERALREELARRQPSSSTSWRAMLRRWWWAGLLVAAMVTYISLSVSHHSFKPSDWRKPVVSGLRVDEWKQTYGPVMTGAKRRDVTVTLGGRKLGPSIFVHAVSEVNVTVLEDGRTLSGTCGYPDEMLRNGVICTIRDGERLLFESPALTESNRQATFKVAIPPTRQLKFELRHTETHIRMAQGVWTDLKVTR